MIVIRIGHSLALIINLLREQRPHELDVPTIVNSRSDASLFERSFPVFEDLVHFVNIFPLLFSQVMRDNHLDVEDLRGHTASDHICNILLDGAKVGQGHFFARFGSFFQNLINAQGTSRTV